MWPERCVLSMTFVFLVLCPGLSRFSHLTPKAWGTGVGGPELGPQPSQELLEGS